jgi:signal transduction histidine kinase
MNQSIGKQFTPDSLSLGLEAMAREMALERQGKGDPSRTATLVLEYLHKDGSTRWMETVISGIRNDRGFLIGLHGVSRDVTQRRLAEEELKNARDQLRALASRLQDVREETRTAISQDLHDDVGSKLAGLKMEIMRLEGIVGKMPDRPDRVGEKALLEASRRMKDLINKTILSARRIMMELRPSVLDDLGLVAALQWQLEEFRTHTGIDVGFHSDEQHVDLQKRVATVVFRIFQEALANVARHSGAQAAVATLKTEGAILILELKDNGRGITEEQLSRKDSLGLMGMRERALVLGGDIRIRGEAGKGTTLTLRVPVNRRG